MSWSEFNTGAGVLVVGDAMLDRYFEGDASRISPEAPVPVLHVRSTFERPGGAANVALNIAALGVPVTLLCYVGRDQDAVHLRELLTAGGVSCSFVEARNARTIVKLRALSMKQQVLRMDFEDGFGTEDHAVLAREFDARIGAHNLVVMSDYAKGTLNEVANLIATARQRGVPVLVDPKGTEFERYRGATLLTPNLKEFCVVAGTPGDDDDLLSRAHGLRAELELESLLVTRGEHGMTLVAGSGSTTIPACSRDVYDVTGAGDTVIATLAAALVSDMSMEQAIAVANHAAGIVVGRKGTAAVTAKELFQSMSHPAGILDEKAVIAAVEASRAAGQRIVMTNGCFDLLHSGHVDYLTRARQLGDRLVVALNSDASVRRLKGSSRPLNSLAHRQAVLAGLRAVDWVIPFDGSATGDGPHEDTPLDVIRKVRPDVLVKGGDYTEETIVGAREVRAWGGSVEVLPFVEGQSTTLLAQRLAMLEGDIR